MSSSRIRYSKSAKKFFLSHKKIGLNFMVVFDEIIEDKSRLLFQDIVKFHSPKLKNAFRLRIGKYRAIFTVNNGDIMIYVFDVGARGDIYKHNKNI